MSAPLHTVADEDGLRRAEAEADRLFNDPDGEVDYEPANSGEAGAAVARLAARFAGSGGTFNKIIENARAGAKVLSGDRLQGLGEIVQNADDVQATTVQFVLEPPELLVVHDGRPVALRDIHALASPWLTTKHDSAGATGRFGIGLVTLHALADSFEVHCGPYHVRFGDPLLAAVDEPRLPPGLAAPGSTGFRVLLKQGALEAEDLLSWTSRWDDSALLFCATVERVSFATGAGARTLALGWEELDSGSCDVGGRPVPVRRRKATAVGGRSWMVSSADAPSPAGLSRAHKATGSTTPVAVALLLSGGDESGQIHAGLPVVPTRLPLRANAQFDPIASRQALADQPWNDELAKLIADLWTEALLDLFDHQPTAAWAAIPLPHPAAEAEAVGPVARLEALVLDRSRTAIANRLSFAIGGDNVAIADLATEVLRLEGLLAPDELAELAELPAALPTEVRDIGGRWRSVLEDWRQAGADLPLAVTVADALVLAGDESRAPSAAVALAAAALEDGLGSQLGLAPSVVRADGHHMVPPGGTSPHVLVTGDGGLAGTLGMAVALHDAHLAENEGAQAVRDWLVSREALIDGMDVRAVLGRLAAAGTAGSRLRNALDDDQLRALRDAFEPLSQADWTAFGPGVGRAVVLDGFRFDPRGRKVELHTQPAAAYLPKSIDRVPDSFAVAAGATPKIQWLASRYSTVLKSPLGRGLGLGAQKFLGLLGAETAPRLAPHPALEPKYTSETKRGLAANILGSPTARSRRLQEMGADYTLDDRTCPELEAVLNDIARDRKATRRRQRAAAVLATLGRAWSSLGEAAEVPAVLGYYNWQSKGPVSAWWLWQAMTIPWLDDAAATAAAPIRLRLRTSSTIAVHGPNAPGYLHVAFAEARRDVLAALGVMGEPSTADLLDRLRSLRDRPTADDDPATDTAVIYQALAERLAGRTRIPGDVGVTALRRAFGQGHGLIRTSSGWKPPAALLRGPPVFGRHRDFVPHVRDTDRLWSTLQVRLPGVDDCIDVLAELARASASDVATEAVALDTLRLLVPLLEKGPANPAQARRLSRVSLLTSQGWMNTRPVYAVDDPMLAGGLSGEVPVWLPGGELAQFQSLFRLLRLTEISAADVVLVDGAAEVDEEATALFRDAVALLHVDLSRNDPATDDALRVSWASLAAIEVRVVPQLRVRVEGPMQPARTVNVAAKTDVDAGGVLFTDPDALRSVDCGGRVVAGLFAADRRRVAQAWLAAVQEALAGREAAPLELAAERAAAEEAATQADIAAKAQLAKLQGQAAGRRVPGAAGTKKRSGVGGPGGKAGAGAPADKSGSGTQGAGGAKPAPPRVLVDPDSLYVVDPNGKIVSPKSGKGGPGGRRPRARGHVSPRTGGAAPQGSTSARAYTDLEKETIGLRLARMVLASDAEEMIDLRAQHGVGADAMDKLKQFYELKVSAGAEPDRVTLEPSEISLAMSTPDFFLVVVSGVEGVEAQPRVRVIVDPTTQLRMVETSQVRLEGVKNSHSLVFDLKPGQPPTSAPEESP